MSHITKNSPTAFAAYHKNETIRLESSSGGAFTALAEAVIILGGVVFGACFDTDFNVVHDFTDIIEDLAKFRSSKYVQSKIGSSYKKVKEFLIEGRMVLFTGTPCQIAGLNAYLKNEEYENLICQDIICHGVSSPKVWRKYICYREKKAGAVTQKINFRQKNEGWEEFSMSFSFHNGKEYCQTRHKDLMLLAFLQNLCLRPSCHSCSFKTIHRESDITLADFWGVQSLMPDMYDGKGTSLLIINSEKGQRLFDAMKDTIAYKQVDMESAVKMNSAMISSVPVNIIRREFFDNIDKISVDRLFRICCVDSVWVKCKRRTWVMLQKIKH